MTQRVTDEALARWFRRAHDWDEWVLKGSLDPEEATAAVQAIIDRGPRQEVAPGHFPTWKRIHLGVHKTAEAYREALDKQGYRISSSADILGQPQFTVATVEEEVDLVQVTVAELGLENGGTLEQIYAAAKARGLELCPAEVGPALRSQYPDQPLGEWLIVAMEPIRDSGGGLHVFGVGRDGFGPWLDAPWSNPAFVWGAGSRWLFRRRRSA